VKISFEFVQENLNIDLIPMGVNMSVVNGVEEPGPIRNLSLNLTKTNP